MVLDAIRTARLDTLMGDTRPLHRAILEATFLVPLHEPIRQTPQGQTGFKPIEFYKDDQPVLAVFTDLETLQEVMAREGWTQNYWMPMAGPKLCAIAEQGQFSRVTININADINYVMLPMVYRTLAQHLILAGMTTDSLDSIVGQTVIIGKCPAGLPSEEAIAAMREVLEDRGAREAIWYGVVAPPNELHLSLAVAAPEPVFGEIESGIGLAWIKRWPTNTPLRVTRLVDNDTTSAAIREKGDVVFRA